MISFILWEIFSCGSLLTILRDILSCTSSLTIVRLSFVIRSFGLNLGLAESVRMDYCAEERERWCVFDLNMVIGTFVNLLIICTFAEN